MAARESPVNNIVNDINGDDLILVYVWLAKLGQREMNDAW